MSDVGPVLGPRLRKVRQDRRLSGRELARRSGCSPSLVSQIERGQTLPSAGVLYALANELNISIDYLFGAESEQAASGTVEAVPPSPAAPDGRSGQARRVATLSTLDGGGAIRGRRDANPVQRRGERRRIQLSTGVIWDRLTPDADALVDFLEVHYAPHGQSTDAAHMIRHDGREYLLVVEGSLWADIGFESYDLAEGDSVAFDSTTPHKYRNVTDAAARAISVIVHDRR